MSVYFTNGDRTEKLALLGLLAVGVVAVSILALLTLHLAYEMSNSGLDVSKWRTPVDRFLGIHGL
ncbi:MAG: hypothetical protein MK109_03300, partial [Dehalococcoidia bacterium]|nr:hypothetical protein [Dehalococcoidia bacterium]